MLFSPQIIARSPLRPSGGGGGGGGAPIPGLVGWWDASVTASMSLSGSNISTIADQSGNGQTLSSSGFTPPTYNATGFNSRPAMMFSSSGTYLARSVFPMGTGNTLTVFFVGFFTSSTTTYGRICSYYVDAVHGGGSNDADNNKSWLLSRENTGTNAVLYRNGSIAHASVGYSTNVRIIATVDSSGVMTIYINGVATTGNTLNAAFGASGQLALGGLTGATSSPFDGAIAEIGVSTSFTNSTDVATLDTSLKTKWGL
ncbi:hypothetical protein ACRQ5Q_17015 [Bradyrhizobium sp. PMVTL-01]|uniref:hypothetical protein n=1 Tax=Bradyrhizobium sp. PMVTL-01 TaxID=3434999 RepID=UPI003F71AA58